MQINNQIDEIDQAIYEAEQEIQTGAEPVDAILVFEELDKKYFGKNMILHNKDNLFIKEK